MTKHHPRSRHHDQQEDQKEKRQQNKDRGWYCKEHDVKYL